MTPEAVMQMVSTVGFPIGMCLILAWYVKTRDDVHTEQLNRITQEHTEEAKLMTEAIQNNTLTIQKLVDILQKGE